MHHTNAARSLLDEQHDNASSRFHQQAEQQRETDLLIKVVRLAPTLDVAEALLRGEPVPLRYLDQRWAKSYGLL